MDHESIKAEISEISRLPQSTVDADASTAKRVLQLLETLDDNDDVQSVTTNLDVSPEVAALLAAD